MTDKEIIKALERCSRNKFNDCCGCPCFISDGRTPMQCMSDLMKNALDLINRQQAEIERLKKLLDEEEKKNLIFAKRFYKEGVEEFAERLSNKIINTPSEITETSADYLTGSAKRQLEIIDYIDEIRKEMVGDE